MKKDDRRKGMIVRENELRRLRRRLGGGARSGLAVAVVCSEPKLLINALARKTAR